MSIERDNVWVRIAGHAKRIREGDPFHWRCYVDRAAPEVPLRSFSIVAGEADGRNVLPGADPAASNDLGLTAWIDVYGDIAVADGIAMITLRPAPDR